MTAVLHSAGMNRPQPLSSLDREDFLATLAPKVGGLRRLLEALDASRLRLLVTFGSVIARSGMRGEADYAVANAWLRGMTERFQARNPSCLCLAIEWSVWAGIGMGQRLGRLEALAREGISPIAVDAGVEMLRRLVEEPPDAVAMVVTGRMPESPTVSLEQAELPLLRFLEQPRVHVPGVELVTEVELDESSDPYLAEHELGGERLFPAVLGLEAMAQVACALSGEDGPPGFEQVRFERPVVVPAGRKVRLRLLALRQTDGSVDVALRSEETGFQADHFSATCRWAGTEPAEPSLAPVLGRARGPVALDPAADLYGGVLFQQGRFRRLSGYGWVSATECLSEVGPEPAHKPWFGHVLPGRLLLGDPAARDAVVHGIQVCIPHATVLPVGIEQLEAGEIESGAPVSVAAKERSRDGDRLVYDLEVVDSEGRLVERWAGLALKALPRPEPERLWPAPLLGPLLERRAAEDLAEAELAVLVEEGDLGESRRELSNAALRRLLGEPVQTLRRADGKPEVLPFPEHRRNGYQVSTAHAGALTLAVAGEGPVGCDLEPVARRGADVWRQLLGRRFELSREISASGGEDPDRAGTRVWAAAECLRKAGSPLDAPLALASIREDGWVLLRSGSLRISTAVLGLKGSEEPVVFAILLGSGQAAAVGRTGTNPGG